MALISPRRCLRGTSWPSPTDPTHVVSALTAQAGGPCHDELASRRLRRHRSTMCRLSHAASSGSEISPAATASMMLTTAASSAPRERRFKQGLVPEAARTAVHPNLARVHRPDHEGLEPARLRHFGKLRMALRYCLAPSS